MEKNDLACPCNPQCPNYGKCRQCIAMHARFYTPPHCVKWMLEDMKKNHIHPINPHIKKSLKERVNDYFRENANATLKDAAIALKITEWQLLDAMDRAVAVPKNEFLLIYNEFATFDKVLLHINKGCSLIQVETKLLPLDKDGVCVLKKDNLTMMIFESEIYACFLVKEYLHDRNCYSLAIVDEDENVSLSIYLPHNEKAESIFSKFCKRLCPVQHGG